MVAVLAAALDAIHRLIGIFQCGREVAVGVSAEADPDAQADAGLPRADLEGLAEACQPAPHDHLDTRRCHARQLEQELIPAEARGQMMMDAQMMQLFIETVGEQYQHFIASTMSQRIIDLLEAIHVDEQQRTVVRQLTLEPAIDGLAIGKSRQCIGAGQGIETSLVILLVADVGMSAQQAQRLAIRVTFDDSSPVRDPGDAAVSGQHAMHHLIDFGAPGEMVLEIGEHLVAVFRVEVISPDIEMSVQLAGLITQHAPPAIVEDGELAGGNFQLPETQTRAVEGRRQLLLQTRDTALQTCLVALHLLDRGLKRLLT